MTLTDTGLTEFMGLTEKVLSVLALNLVNKMHKLYGNGNFTYIEMQLKPSFMSHCFCGIFALNYSRQMVF